MNTQQPRASRFTSQQLVSIALASAGVGVTLIGVVLLLAMAAREGLLTPPVRVGGGALLAAVLAGAAVWVRPRAGGRVGSVALLATGAAAAFFDVVAVTRIYDWVPLGIGLALALAVGAGTGALAVTWREKHLFHALVWAVALLAPWLTEGVNLALVGFLAALQVVGVVPEVRRGWDSTALVRTVPVVLAGFFWVLSRPEDSLVPVVVVSAVVALVAFGGLVLADRTRKELIFSAAAFVLAWIPLWTASALCERPVRVAVCGAVVAVMLGALHLLRQAGSLVRMAFVLVAGVSGIVMALACAYGDWKALPFLAAAIVLMLLHVRVSNTTLGYLALGCMTLGFLLQCASTPYLDLFYRSRVEHLPASAPVAGVLFLLFGLAGAAAVRGKNLSTDYVQTTLVACGSTSVLGLAMTTIAVAGGSETGFYAGHLFITVISMALAALVLTAGLRRPRHLGASMVWGLALVACALAKLFLFDLNYLGTMTRAFSFLGAGLVLLAAGTAYARTYATVAAKKPAQADAGSVEPGAGTLETHSFTGR